MDVVVTGTNLKDLQIHGPFCDADTALAWASYELFLEDNWVIKEIKEPVAVDEKDK